MGVVFVPEQHNDIGPFIIAKVVTEEEHLKEIVVGYAQRVGGVNEPILPKKLQMALRRGQDSQSQRLARLEAKVDRLLERAAPIEELPQPDAELLQARISEILKEIE